MDCLAEFDRYSLKTMTNVLIQRSAGSTENCDRRGVDNRYPLALPAAGKNVADVADGNSSATDPLHANSNEIIDMSGVAE